MTPVKKRILKESLMGFLQGKNVYTTHLLYLFQKSKYFYFLLRSTHVKNICHLDLQSKQKTAEFKK